MSPTTDDQEKYDNYYNNDNLNNQDPSFINWRNVVAISIALIFGCVFLLAISYLLLTLPK